MNALILLSQLFILLFSVVIHEVSHGAMANYLGDPTAKESGRLSLNPIKHLDFFGSFLVPLTLYLLSGGTFVFGWAKPVPFDPMLLRKPKRDTGLVAFAGPMANFILAIFFGLLIRIFHSSLTPFLILFSSWVVEINLLLGIFNLVPIPPLDGSKIILALAPDSWLPHLVFLERYGLWILLIFLFFGFSLIIPIISFFYRILTSLTITL